MRRSSRQARWSVSLGVTCALALSACGNASNGGGADAGASGAAPAKGPISTQTNDKPITIWVRQAAPGLAVYKKIAADFSAKVGKTVNVEAYGSDFNTKVLAAATAKTLPDLLVGDAAAMGSYVNLGITVPFAQSEIAGSADLSPRAVATGKYLDGKYYGVPVNAHAFMLMVRQDWLTQLGLQPPKTWDEQAKVADAFTKAKLGGPTTAGLLLQASATLGYTTFAFLPYLISAGGSFVTDNGDGKVKASFSGTAASAAYDYVLSQFCGPNKTVQASAINDQSAQTQAAFIAGTGGLYAVGPYALGAFDKSPGADKYTALAPTVGPSGKVGALAEGENAYFMQDSKNPGLARQFVEYLVSPEGQIAGMTTDKASPIVRLPINTKVDIHQVLNDPRWDLDKKIYDESGVYVPILPDWQEIRQVAADALNAQLSTCAPGTTALPAVNKAISDQLSKDGVLAK